MNRSNFSPEEIRSYWHNTHNIASDTTVPLLRVWCTTLGGNPSRLNKQDLIDSISSLVTPLPARQSTSREVDDEIGADDDLPGDTPSAPRNNEEELDEDVVGAARRLQRPVTVENYEAPHKKRRGKMSKRKHVVLSDEESSDDDYASSKPARKRMKFLPQDEVVKQVYITQMASERVKQLGLHESSFADITLGAKEKHDVKALVIIANEVATLEAICTQDNIDLTRYFSAIYEKIMARIAEHIVGLTNWAAAGMVSFENNPVLSMANNALRSYRQLNKYNPPKTIRNVSSNYTSSSTSNIVPPQSNSPQVQQAFVTPQFGNSSFQH